MNIKMVAGKVGAAVVLAGAALVVGGQSADAATSQTTFQVTATVTTTCSLTAPTLAFPDYTGAVDDGSTTITVDCTNGTAPNVILDLGLNPTGSVRQMALGAGRLAYNLSAVTQGNNDFPTAVPGVAAAATGITAISVLGRIPANQSPPPGAYSDTVTATVTY